MGACAQTTKAQAPAGGGKPRSISILQATPTPIMIHIKTQKGKGYSYAEKASDHYHGVSKFNVETGEQQKSGSNLPAYTKVFANTLVKHAKKDSDRYRIVRDHCNASPDNDRK